VWAPNRPVERFILTGCGEIPGRLSLSAEQRDFTKARVAGFVSLTGRVTPQGLLLKKPS